MRVISASVEENGGQIYEGYIQGGTDTFAARLACVTARPTVTSTTPTWIRTKVRWMKWVRTTLVGNPVTV